MTPAQRRQITLLRLQLEAKWLDFAALVIRLQWAKWLMDMMMDRILTRQRRAN
jgi:hypothetical protein